MAAAAKSFANGTVAVAQTAGGAVADALHAVAGVFRGRRLAALLGAAGAPHASAGAGGAVRALLQSVPAASGREAPPGLGNCTLLDLGVSAQLAAAMAPAQQAALLAACCAVLRLSPGAEASLAAAMQAAAEPFVDDLAQVALPLIVAAIGEAATPPGKPPRRSRWRAPAVACGSMLVPCVCTAAKPRVPRRTPCRTCRRAPQRHGNRRAGCSAGGHCPAQPTCPAERHG